MALPILLSKLKTFFPVLVVGGAVAVTIKLLTASNTLSSKIIKVNAEEDIAETKHEEVLEEEKTPELPEEELPQADESQEPREDEESEDEADDSNGEENSGNQEEQEPVEQKQEKEEDTPKAGRSLITDTLVGATLQEILKE